MQKATVTKPIVDLRKEPQELPKDYSHHPLRDSQLLFGEPLRIHRQERGYYYIEALEQKKFTENEGWHGYFGWVHKEEVVRVEKFHRPNLVVAVKWASLFHDPRGCRSAFLKLSYGTTLTGEKHQKAWKLFLHGRFTGFAKGSALRPLIENRRIMMKEATAFLHAPYLWGGRGAHGSGSSVDCSGLISLLFKSQGISIPRDAHDQYLMGKPVRFEELRRGDAIYLQKKENTRITHVIFCLEKRIFIESPQTGETIRLLNEGEEIWFKENTCIIHGRPNAYLFFCRRF